MAIVRCPNAMTHCQRDCCRNMVMIALQFQVWISEGSLGCRTRPYQIDMQNDLHSSCYKIMNFLKEGHLWQLTFQSFISQNPTARGQQRSGCQKPMKGRSQKNRRHRMARCSRWIGFTEYLFQNFALPGLAEFAAFNSRTGRNSLQSFARRSLGRLWWGSIKKSSVFVSEVFFS